MTNDAWFFDTPAPYQHAQSSVFRAVENRVPVVRAANTGLSCFIDKNGRIFNSVKVGGKEILVAGYKTDRIAISKSESFYSRFGEVFIYLCVFILIVDGVYRRRRGRQIL